MKSDQNLRRVSLTTLMSHLKEGRYIIPGFQREFEWLPSDINELMRSIFRDYYIGSLLMWEGKKESFKALTCDSIYGAPEPQNPSLIVLDGQQRLSAMYYAFFAPEKNAPHRKKRSLFFIRVDQYMSEAYERAFYYDSRAQIWELFDDSSRQFENHIFPLAIIGQGIRAVSRWIRDYEEYWKKKEQDAKIDGNEDASQIAGKHAQNADEFGDRLLDIMEQYHIVSIELDSDIELGKVCDIFTRINSRGVKLDIFDLMNALLNPKNLGLKNMWRKEEAQFELVGTEKMNVYVLQVMSILRQNYCSPKHLYNLLPGHKRKVRGSDGLFYEDILVKDKDDFEKLWQLAIKELCSAIELLRHPQEFGVVLPGYLPYTAILPAFAAVQSATKELQDERKLDAQHKVKRWYWASVFTNRYSSAVESTSAGDYQDLKKWFDDDTKEPDLITDAVTFLEALDLRREVRRGTSIYNGVFNLLVMKGARDWATGTVPLQDGSLDDHHIVPKSWEKNHNLTTSINTILNRTPLSADTNRRVISNHLPNKYLPKLIEGNGEQAVREILESHLISPAAFEILMRDPFTPDDYEDFIKERERTLLEEIKKKV